MIDDDMTMMDDDMAMMDDVWWMMYDDMTMMDDVWWYETKYDGVVVWWFDGVNII